MIFLHHFFMTFRIPVSISAMLAKVPCKLDFMHLVSFSSISMSLPCLLAVAVDRPQNLAVVTMTSTKRRSGTTDAVLDYEYNHYLMIDESDMILLITIIVWCILKSF